MPLLNSLSSIPVPYPVTLTETSTFPLCRTPHRIGAHSYTPLPPLRIVLALVASRLRLCMGPHTRRHFFDVPRSPIQNYPSTPIPLDPRRHLCGLILLLTLPHPGPNGGKLRKR